MKTKTILTTITVIISLFIGGCEKEDNSPATDKLDFRDYALSSYAESGTDAADLSRNETAFIQATRNFLDDPDNAVINVVMWSWCNIAGWDGE